jgi:pyrimidine-nucleoside phosphorylase
MTVSLVELIAKKRDNLRLTEGELKRLITGYMDGSFADYQMSAFLMAAFLNPLDEAETVALTEAMLHSGDVLKLASVPGIKVDKHSTGGVGDKISIALAPLVAACGVPVPMVSGRGLGHTGGTLDKLEAIPGFRTDLPTDEFERIVKEVGTCMIGQTKEIAPADKRIYALRDVTSTVESIPLIVASILSKKLAEGIDALVLDVKVGKGAFMKDEASARRLAEALVRTGTRAGKKVVALLTRMDAPIGYAVGNANETIEAIDVLHGTAPDDTTECTLALGAEMLVLGGKATDVKAARALMDSAIKSGAALRTLEKMIAAQYGDPRVVMDRSLFPQAPVSYPVAPLKSGYVMEIDSHEIGLCAVQMGAGRTRAEQAVDPAVGIDIVKKPGARVGEGDYVAILRTRTKAQADAVYDRVQNAFKMGDQQVEPKPLVIDRITA